MAGLVLAMVFGIVGGNLAAVAVKAVNIGLWWNSVVGALAAAAVILLPARLVVLPGGSGMVDLLLQAGAGFLAVLIIGGLVGASYRD
ncbi:MAG: hypothetical protein KDA67_01430 [Rhodobacteraceae bacterium]|nr:hypothetical protein [Paracoccaceae bacterium]